MADDKPPAHAPTGAVPSTTTEPSMDGYQADRDWQWFLLVSFVLILWILRVLVYLVTDQFYTTMWAGLLLWVVFGGHKYLQAPVWLREPVGSKPSQSTCDCHCKSTVFATKTTSPGSVNFAPVPVLSRSPAISTLTHSPLEPTVQSAENAFPALMSNRGQVPQGLAVGTFHNTFSPVTSILDHAPQRHGVTSTETSLSSVMADSVTTPVDGPDDSKNAALSPVIIKTESSVGPERNDKMLKDDYLSLLAADTNEEDGQKDENRPILPDVCDVSHARRMLAELDGFSSRPSVPSSASVDRPDLCDVSEARRLLAEFDDPSSASSGSSPLPVDREKLAEDLRAIFAQPPISMAWSHSSSASVTESTDEAEDEAEDHTWESWELVLYRPSSASSSSRPSDGTSKSHETGYSRTSAHVSSPSTAPSSAGGVSLDEREAKLAHCPEQPISAADLERLVKEHGHPAFYEGEDNAIYTHYFASRELFAEVESVYNEGESEASSFAPTVISTWCRPVADDTADVKHMIHMLRDYVPIPWVEAEVEAFCRRREGMTGLCIAVDRLETTMWQHKPTNFFGVPQYVFANLADVIDFQMSLTRRRREDALLVSSEEQLAGCRMYLTDAQTVEINEGCCEYAPRDNNGLKCNTLLYLESFVDPEARRPNTIPQWLEGTDEDGFYNPNAYVPCICGQAALEAHEIFRSTSDTAPDIAYEVHEQDDEDYELTLLSEDALQSDRSLKAIEAAHSDDPAIFPRSQKFSQVCELHAIPTNRPWILIDGVEDLNAALINKNNDLPVPGFCDMLEYPEGQRLYRGFQEIPHAELPPRCSHGYLHPPFTDHCVECFPSGEHHECAECEAHRAARDIKQHPVKELQWKDDGAQWNDSQNMKLWQSQTWEEEKMQEAEATARNSNYLWEAWPPLKIGGDVTDEYAGTIGQEPQNHFF